MGDCCNVKTLSYISASLQLAGWIITILVVTVLGAALNTDAVKKHDEAGEFLASVGTVVVIVIAIIAVIAIAFLVTLIVGIKQNRVTLVSIYVYATLVYLSLTALSIFYSFVMGFVNKHEVGAVFLGFFLNLIYVGMFILMFAPIFLLHRQMSNPTFQPEQHGLRGNQPVHKPHYVA